MNTNIPDETELKSRITLSGTIGDAVVAMSDGNPGAVNVLLGLLRNTKRIDPDDAFEGLGPIMTLDTLGVYGPKIWMLAKDVCKHELPMMLAVLRAFQLGFISQKQIETAIDNHGDGLDLEDIHKKVSKALPNFKLLTPDELD